jgi:hypothetical protein
MFRLRQGYQSDVAQQLSVENGVADVRDEGIAVAK